MTGWRTSSTSSACTAGSRPYAAMPRQPMRSWRACGSCAPAKRRRTIRRSASPRPSPPSPTAGQRRRCVHSRGPHARRRPRDKPWRLVWAWSLAVRAAHEVSDAAATQELLALLDSYQPGHVVPLLRAERDLARARLAGQDDDQRRRGRVRRGHRQPARARHPLPPRPRPARPRPVPAPHGDDEAAAAAIDEARAIGARLRCQPLLDRAEAIENQNAGYRPNRALRCGVSSVDRLDGAGAARLTEGVGRAR